MDRRDFLKLFGVALGAVATGAMAPWLLRQLDQDELNLDLDFGASSSPAVIEPSFYIVENELSLHLPELINIGDMFRSGDPQILSGQDGQDGQPTPPRIPNIPEAIFKSLIVEEGGRKVAQILGVFKDSKLGAYIYYSKQSFQEIVEVFGSDSPLVQVMKDRGIQQVVTSYIRVSDKFQGKGIGTNVFLWAEEEFVPRVMTNLAPGSPRLIIDMSNGWASKIANELFAKKIIEQIIYTDTDLGLFLFWGK